MPIYSPAATNLLLINLLAELPFDQVHPMKEFRLPLVLLTLIFIHACAATEKEVPTDQLGTSPNIVRLNGEVTNIREVKKDATFGKRFGGAFIGSLVGGQIGGGSTSTIIGADIADDKYGEVVDRLILTDANGKEYECLVHGHGFKVGDPVVFTLVEGHVSAIIHASSDQ